ncbi:MAG: hypothetical protein ACO230_03000 [Ilumatobacteraceae bacterium]
MSLDDFIDACQPWLSGADVPWSAAQYRPEIFRAMAELVQTRIVTLSEVPQLVDFMFLDAPLVDEASWSKTFGAADAVAMLRSGRDALASCDWTSESLKSAVEAAGASLGLKSGAGFSTKRSTRPSAAMATTPYADGSSTGVR